MKSKEAAERVGKQQSVISASCFVDEEYEMFLKKVNGYDESAWMQYDLVSGAFRTAMDHYLMQCS